MVLADILETLMLICFSTSWYWSIRKVWREQDSRSVQKLFPALVAAGCLLGLGSKLADQVDGHRFSGVDADDPDPAESQIQRAAA